MNLIIWLVIGGVIGWLASIAMKTDGQQGIVLNVVVGIVGAFVGGLIGSALGFGGVTEFDIRSFAIAILGAIVVLLAWRAVRGAGHGYA